MTILPSLPLLLIFQLIGLEPQASSQPVWAQFINKLIDLIDPCFLPPIIRLTSPEPDTALSNPIRWHPIQNLSKTQGDYLIIITIRWYPE